MFKTPPKNINIKDVIKNAEKIKETMEIKEKKELLESVKKDNKKIRVVDIYNDNVPWEF